ncbi:MAG: hypothetical protein ACJAU1_000280 [Psychromonas sp.]|jgi:hypothetical protein
MCGQRHLDLDSLFSGGADHSATAIVTLIDVLIDGKFERGLADPGLLAWQFKSSCALPLRRNKA